MSQPFERSASPDLSAVEVIAPKPAWYVIGMALFRADKSLSLGEAQDLGRIAAEALLSAGSVQYGVRYPGGYVYTNVMSEADADAWVANRPGVAVKVQRRSGLPVDEEWKDSQ